jgi:hypothetical protein
MTPGIDAAWGWVPGVIAFGPGNLLGIVKNVSGQRAGRLVAELLAGARCSRAPGRRYLDRGLLCR